MMNEPSGVPAVPTPAPAGDPVPASAGAPRGGIAEAIFAEVEQMTAGGAMSKSDAFEAISARTGRRAGTVAANYYRIARKRGVALEPRVRRGPGRPTGSGRGPGGGDAEAIIARLEGAVKDLATLLRSQDAELTRLREQADQFDQLKALIAKS
jgi:hypothetical protein